MIAIEINNNKQISFKVVAFSVDKINKNVIIKSNLQFSDNSEKNNIITRVQASDFIALICALMYNT